MILLIETSRAMSKGFLDHNLFHDPNVTTIHRDYPDNRAKDVRISILCPALTLIGPLDVGQSDGDHLKNGKKSDIGLLKTVQN